MARQNNLVSAPIASTLLAFALPTLASSVLQSANGSIDTVWVGQLIGEDAVAATTNGNLVMFLMTAFVGLMDGLVRRDIRRFGAGRESGFIYHRARASLIPLAVLPWVTYLALPVSVNPLLILLPSAALLGVAVCIAAATFKKYL